MPGSGADNFDGSSIPHSPRFREACARLGIDPEELREKPVQAFKEPGLEQWALQMRYDHAEHKRAEKVKAVQREWKQIKRSGGDGRSRTHDTSFLDGGTESTVKREQMQMEKLKRRQQQEIEQMIAYEIKQSEIQQQLEEKEHNEQQRHQAHIADVARRKKEFEQKKKAIEEKKREEEAHEQHLVALKASEDFKREQKRQQELSARAAQDAKEARKREVERRQKQEEHKAETERILAAQQAEIEQKRILLEEKEAVRTQQMEAERLEIAEQRQRKREEAQRRIESAHQSQAELLEAQKREFAEKERIANQRRDEWEQERAHQYQENRRKAAQKREDIQRAIENAANIEATRKSLLREKEDATEKRLNDLEMQKEHDQVRRRREIEEKQNQRKAAKNRSEHEQEERKQRLIEHQSHMNDGFEKVMAERDMAIARKREESRLKAMDIQENVERLKRQQEYKKIQALQKMQDDEQHQAMVASKRQEIQDQRKKMSQDSVRARAELSKMMDDMRKTKKTKDPAELLKMAGLDVAPPNTGGHKQMNRSKVRTASAPPARPAAKQQWSAPPPQQQSRPTTASTGGGQGLSRSKSERQHQPKARPTSSHSVQPRSQQAPRAHQAPRSASNSRSAPAHPKRGMSATSSGSEGRRKAKRQPRRAPAMHQENLTQDEAQHIVEELRRRQNEDLLLVLEQEQRNETDREIELTKVTDPNERRRLEQLFGVERARASERIMQHTAEHEAVLSAQMKELNLL